jgi:hypothetical protein
MAATTTKSFISEENGSDLESIEFSNVDLSVHTSTDSQSNDQMHKQPHQNQALSEKETKSVGRLRIGMMLLLIISAIIAGSLSYWYLRRTEHNRFQSMFRDDASKLSQALNTNILNMFGSLDLLSTIMVTHSNAADETFPFTTIPHFANIASKLLSMSAALTLITQILVDGKKQRLKWENYAWKHRSIVNNTLEMMETDPNYYGNVPWNISTVKSLHGDFEPVPYNES